MRRLCLPSLVVIGLTMFHLTPGARAQSDPFPGVFPAVTTQMQRFIDAKEISGAVTMVVSPDRVLHLGVNGMADIEQKRAQSAEDIFWIASMTKPVTGVAIAILREEGKLDLQDPVSKYIPEFSQLKNAAGESVQITLLQLLTHSSGLAQDVNRTANPAAPMRTLKDMIPAIVSAPMRFAPGTKWEYCQTGINTLGRIVEVVSGQSYPDFLEARIFAPLGMKDTTFYPTEAQAKRIAVPYQRTPEGALVAADHSVITQGQPVTSRDRVPMANGGLFSTAGDYSRFCQMLLRGGELGGEYYGRRILKPESVALLSTVHSGNLETGFTPGNGWGMAVCIVRQPQGVTAQLSPGTYGHGGRDGTQAWVDPVKKVAYILMVARSNFRNSDNSEVRAAFQKAAAESLPSAGVP